MILGTQLCPWILGLIILVNLPCYVSRTPLTLWRNVDIDKITSCTWQCLLQRYDHPILGFESGGLQSVGYPSREGLPFADPWYEGVERTSVEAVAAAGPLHHRGSDCALVYSFECIVFLWMVDILNINFEPMTFWRVLFVLSILVSVNLMDIIMCKVPMWHEMCYFCVYNVYTVR